MWSLYVDYGKIAVGHIFAMWQAYLFMDYISAMLNVCIPMLLVTLLIALSSYEVYIIGRCQICMAFEGHICY